MPRHPHSKEVYLSFPSKKQPQIAAKEATTKTVIPKKTRRGRTSSGPPATTKVKTLKTSTADPTKSMIPSFSSSSFATTPWHFEAWRRRRTPTPKRHLRFSIPPNPINLDFGLLDFGPLEMQPIRLPIRLCSRTAPSKKTRSRTRLRTSRTRPSSSSPQNWIRRRSERRR